jgi:hypothetical protein
MKFATENPSSFFVLYSFFPPFLSYFEKLSPRRATMMSTAGFKRSNSVRELLF